MEKKVVIITNGATRIGLGCVKEFIQLNYYVVYLDVRRADDKDVRSNQNVVFYNCDMSNHIQIKSVIKHIINKFKQIDSVVNIIDTYPLKVSVFDIDIEKFKKLSDISLTSAISMYRYTFDELKKRDGVIVNILNAISIIGQEVTEGYYDISADRFSSVNSISIGDISHNIHESQFFKKRMDRITSPDEIAKIVSSIVSDSINIKNIDHTTKEGKTKLISKL
jgi:NADP-dependent 3-hydroxy acid dehydrogenase YdfG